VSRQLNHMTPNQDQAEVQIEDPAQLGRVSEGYDEDLYRPSRPRVRTTPAQFLREVEAEMHKVAWPSRPEVVNYSIVVLTTLVIIVALIFALNLAFARGVSFLLQP
jgi:preprotein translocase subunit SecE